MDEKELKAIVTRFEVQGTIEQIAPLGNGLINDTYKVTTEGGAPDYVLQRINNAIFQDVDLLQHNIEAVTKHIRRKLEAAGADDIDRRVLHFVPTAEGKTYLRDEADRYWRVMVFIPHAQTFDMVNPEYSYYAGRAFGHFEAMLVDIPDTLGETIPDFHNMELRIRQLRASVQANPMGRLAQVQDIVDELEAHADEMCKAEQMGRQGVLPKRICHCDTKVNNMMFDEQGRVLCVIDLDTVMPAFVFSDFGDFLRTAANTVAEDDPAIERVEFRKDIFEAFAKGYLESATFLTPVERNHLPFAVALFPYMQCVRFLTDYINGDTYYKIKYPEHNLVRTRNQLQLFRATYAEQSYMRNFIDQCK